MKVPRPGRLHLESRRPVAAPLTEPPRPDYSLYYHAPGQGEPPATPAPPPATPPMPPPPEVPPGRRIENVPIASARGVFGMLLFVVLVGLVLLEPISAAVTFAKTGALPGPPALTTAQAILVLWVTAIVTPAIASISFGYVALVRPGENVLRVLGLVGKPREIAIGVAVGIAFVIVESAVGYLLLKLGFSPDISTLSTSFGAAVKQSPALIVVIPATAALAEETLFRGLFMPRMGLIASSILFGVAHATYGTIFQVVSPLVLGLVLGILVRKRGNLWAAIAAHFTLDVIALSALAASA